MAKARWSYWGGFAALTAASLGMLFLFVFGFLPQRFLLELDFAESDFQYPVILPESAQPQPPARTTVARRPIPRTPAERLWAEYLPLAAAGDLERALDVLARYLEAHPDDVGARLEYGRVAWKLGRLRGAVAAYEEALRRAEDPAARRELAGLYADAGRWNDALAIYRTLAERDADLELLIAYARTATAAERYAEAAEAYERVLRRRPHDLEVLSAYADVATWAEDYERAAGLYARLVAARPDDPATRLSWARVLYWSGDAAAADRVLAGLPDDLASPAADSLRTEVAAALPRPDTLTPSVLKRARGLVLESAVDSALALYRIALAEGPAADSLLLELADVFQFRAESGDSAIAYLRRYLQLRPANGDVRMRLARLLAWSGRLGEAETALAELLAAEPERAEAWALLGDIRRWRGEPLAAADAYERALAVEPNEPTANEGRATLRSQVEAQLARRGDMGPAGGFERVSDSDEFERLRWSAGWMVGRPSARVGTRVAVERVSGYEPAGANGNLTGVELGVRGERWWRLGTVHTSGYLGVWIPGAEASSQPVVALAAELPELGGAAYRAEYRHEPAYREASTLESALTDLVADQAMLSSFRVIGSGWETTARGRLTWISGADADNRRADVALGLFHRPDDNWFLGAESRGLGFSEAAPRPGRRLYWDPKWSWENVAVLGWRNEPASGLELEARVTPGFAWLEERDLDPALVFIGGAQVDWGYQFGDGWLLTGGAGINQTRAGDYRAWRLRLGLERRGGGQR